MCEVCRAFIAAIVIMKDYASFKRTGTMATIKWSKRRGSLVVLRLCGLYWRPRAPVVEFVAMLAFSLRSTSRFSLRAAPCFLIILHFYYLRASILIFQLIKAVYSSRITPSMTQLPKICIIQTLPRPGRSLLIPADSSPLPPKASETSKSNKLPSS